MRRAAFLVVLALLAASPATAATKGRPGTLDPGFGHGGKVFAKAPKATAISRFGAAGLEGDGDLVVELHHEGADKEGGIREIERRLPDGSLDSSFGKGGKVRVGLGSGLAVRSDGSILVGTNSCGPKKGSLLLLDAAGDKATGFGKGGCGPKLEVPTTYIEIGPGGSIFVGGTDTICPCGAKSVPKIEPAVAKLQPNGALDPSFGKAGVVHLDADLGIKTSGYESNDAAGIAPTADGGVVVAAEKQLVGLGANGALASGFGTGGKAELGAYSTALTALADGRLVVAASVKKYSFEPATAAFVSRFLPDGSPDSTFATAGKLELPLAEETEIEGLQPAPGEGVLMAGETGHGKNCAANCHVTMFLARLGGDGRLESGYGNQGILDLPLPPSQGYERSPGISALAVSAAGRAVVTGGESSTSAYAIGASPSGSLDTGFGEGGTLLESHYLPSTLEPSGIALAPKGEIVVAAEGESAGAQFGGYLLGFRPDGRQTSGTAGNVSQTAARNEIVPVRGGFAGTWEQSEVRSELTAVRRDGRTLRSYGDKGTVVLPHEFDIYGIDPGPAGGAVVLGTIGEAGAMAIYRVGPTGRPVGGFGKRGLVQVRFGHEAARAYATTATKGGAIVVTGFAGAWTAAAKLLPNGRLDQSFGRGGRVRGLLAEGTFGTKIAALGGGVVIGSTTADTPYRVAGLVRLDRRGQLVRGFGRKGAVRPPAEGRLLGLFTHRGRITVISDDEFAKHSPGGVELRAYRPDGAPDRGFGKGGVATGGIAQSRFFSPTVAAQEPDGKIVVVGAAWNGELSQDELLRFR